MKRSILIINSLAFLLIGGLALHSTGALAQVKKPESAVSVKLVQPHSGDITRSIILPGVVAANQQVALYAKVGGYLKSIAVDKGDKVKQGEFIAELEVPELLADQSKYKAEVMVAELDYKRIMEAQKKAPDLVVLQSVDTAKGKYEVTKANLERAETLLGYCKITAPFSGVITRRSVDPGAFIPAATSGSSAQTMPLVTVSDFSIVRVQVAVPESESSLVKNGIPASVMVEGLQGVALPGKVTRYSHSLDENTRTMLVEIDLPNSEGKLLPGMYASVKLGIETRTNVLLTLTAALMVEKSGSSVFMVADSMARKVPVKTGFNDGTMVEITEGLKPKEQVILLGKQSLNPGQAVTVENK